MLVRKPISLIGKTVFSFKKKKVPENPRKILFLKTGALGDVIMTTPLLREIRKKFPYSVIDYAVGKSYADVLKNNKNIDSVITFDENIFYDKFRSKERGDLGTKLAARDYDLIFVLDKHWAFGTWASHLGGFRIGFDRSGEGFANNANIVYRQKKHEIVSYLDLALFFGIKSKNTKTEIFTTKDDRQRAKEIIPRGRYVCVAPGGGNPGKSDEINATKLWSKERYLELVQELGKKYNIILVGGKNDRKIIKWIKKKAKTNKEVIDASGTTIQATAEIMRRARFIVTNDSGAMHIATAVNDKIIALFGTSNPNAWGPLNGTIVWKGKKSGENMYGKYTHDENLMKKISVEDVLDAAKKYRKK